jgi:SAM-dependent methyltransferase
VTQASPATQAAETYYDSNDADQFYFNIWGGEDIHIGIYDEADTRSIREASRLTIDRMLELLGLLGPEHHVLDLGAGYGGAARSLARRCGCKVTCLNLSETQNARNRELTEAAGVGDRVFVRHGNFEHLPFDDASFSVAWSQDAILHSGARSRVVEEVARVLEPGGRFVFTDPMRRAEVPVESLGPILERIHLDDLASFEFYREACAKAGLEMVKIDDLSDQLPRHYDRVRRELESRRAEIEALASPAYVANMLEGLRRWVSAGRDGLLAWGIMLARKPA